jgi:hypothetical protein
MPSKEAVSMSVPCFTFPKSGSSPDTIWAASVYPTGKEIIRLFGRGWREEIIS